MQIGSSNYYYAKDHLGSIRELTDSSGAVQARYEYDPYGRRTKLSGSLDADFGFTGHYYHQPSALHLALYRAYDAELGRWISRDPIGELGGTNVYGYALNNTINLFDPFGLDALVFDGTLISLLSSNGDIVMTVPAVSGPFGKGAAPNGLYTVDNYRDRGPVSGDYNPNMTIDGFGFSYDLTPAFPTDRTLLRIHPDGGKPGSEGCIALRARRKQLQDFVTRVNAYLRAYGMIPVLVNQ